MILTVRTLFAIAQDATLLGLGAMHSAMLRWSFGMTAFRRRTDYSRRDKVACIVGGPVYRQLHSHADGDCGYAAVQRRAGDTISAATYVKYRPGPDSATRWGK